LSKPVKQICGFFS